MERSEDSTLPTPSSESSKKEEKVSFLQRVKNAFKPQSDDDSIQDKAPPVPFFQLFAYANKQELIMMAIAVAAAIVHGTLLPLFTIIFGSIIDVFSGTDDDPDSPNAVLQEELVDEIGGVAKYFLILAVVAFITSLIQVRFQLIVAQRIGNRLRRLYFNSLMRQDYSWYDHNDGGELTTRVAGDVNLVEAGIGDKVSSAVQFSSMFLTGFIIAFIYGWKLTLIMLTVCPLLGIGGALFGKLAAESSSSTQGAYGAAGGIASEVISLIKTVTAYNGQESEAHRYEHQLQKAYRSGVKKAAFSGAALGFTYFVIFCTFAIAFTFGANQERNGEITPGDIIVTFFSIFIATISIGQAAPAFNAFAVARGAAPRVYEIIRRKSEIDPLADDEGIIPENIRGEISCRNINFNYPTRVVDDAEDEGVRPFVLNSFDLNINPGENHALVGSSGCGKSTTVRLIERFYDVQEGKVLIDGVDVRDLNVRWLRSQIGYVGQMPTLFMLTIRENIALGAAMESSIEKDTGKRIWKRASVTDDEIIAAAQKANAHDFIMKLPEKYETMLGERGALLSGGQKQRICIARALIRNPKILLLDESTSALDAQSERVVQEALEKASAGRTTVTIAHRLSTVKNADMISVIDKGRVVESGKHNDLITVEGGAYRKLVEYQNVQAQRQAQEASATEAGADAGDVGADAGDVGEAFKAETTTVGQSLSKTVQGVDGEEKDKPDVDKGVIGRAFSLNRAEIPFMLVGMLGAALAGASFPAMAVGFARVINVIGRNNEPGEVSKWAWVFVGIGAGSFLGYFLHYLMLGISGERLTRKLRGLAFRSILKQDMGFFDMKNNSVGNLTTRLATESTLVEGVTGSTLGGIALVSSTLLTGFLIAFLACWRVALVVTVIFPFMAVSEATNIKMMQGFDADAKFKFAKAGAVASEAVDNYDTLSSIGVQDVFIERYNKELEGPLRTGRKSALLGGIMFGIAEFLAQALWAIAFWVGSIFVRNDQCQFGDLMEGISGLLFAGSALGQASLFLPDVGKSKVAATNVFRLIDRASAIDPTSSDGVNAAEVSLKGEVAAKDLKFEYPSRPDVAVLRGMSVEVKPGKTLALVGESGSGKSTIVSLIERFYDPRSGGVTIDGRETRDYNLKSIRGQMGLVSQEPDLFNRTVRDNIAYGLSHEDGTPVTDSMIIEAAKTANAHDFISELPDGYDTEVGVRGSKLSGGQRQRVAIARSLVRSPRVLLLDEATSALDAVSERLVQDALDSAAKGRTTIAIAHRLSTIKDADVIAVLKNGKVVESGKHDQLLRLNGVYAKLVKNQMSETPAK